MCKSRIGLIAVSIASLTANVAVASGIPISGPLVISQSGYYVVTADFAAPDGTSAIEITDDVLVDINLNGHTISGEIMLNRFGYFSPHCVSLRLRNGRLSNGKLYSVSTFGRPCNGDVPIPTVTLEHVVFEDFGVEGYDSVTTIDSSDLTRSYVATAGDRSSGYLTLTNSVLRQSSLALAKCAAQVYGNIFDNLWIAGGSAYGSFEVYPYFAYVMGNDVLGDVETNSFGYQNWIWLQRNRIRGSLRFSGLSDSGVIENDIGGCTSEDSAVVLDGYSSRNLIEGNAFLGGCAHGIFFNSFSNDNRYSGNTFRVIPRQPIVDFGSRNGSPLDVAPE